MRYVKVLALVLFFFFAMVFFVQNTEILSESIRLKLELWDLRLISVPFPFYVLVLLFFVAGALFTLAFFLVEKIRTTRELRSCRHRVSGLEQELNSLRNLPLEEDRYSQEEISPGA
ncbi:MAG: lipopolysaccharide assembly protein LapA domain-containing protein [Desulfovibrionales bacterium]